MTVAAELEQETIAAVQAVFARYRSDGRTSPQSSHVTVVSSSTEPVGFVHHWPDRPEPTPYERVSRHSVEWNGRTYQVIVAHETGGRPSYGRVRGRIVLFIVAGKAAPYPTVEFTETDRDEGTYAAIIPSPSRGSRAHASIEELDQVLVIPYLAEAEVRAVGELFLDKEAGKTLRLVCDKDDLLLMVTHALQVGRRRGRIF